MQPAFVPYLTLNDYLTTIRSGQLNNQLLDSIEEGGEFERQEAESFAIDEVRSILGSYYYLDFEFRDLLPFFYNRKYYAGDRCIIDFDPWVAGVSSESEEDTTLNYKVGDCVIYNGGGGYQNGSWCGNSNQWTQFGKWIGYCCKRPNADTEFNINNWTAIGNQYDIFYVNFPYPIFQLKPTVQIGIDTPGLYRAGISRVCWERKLYLCRNDSIVPGHQYREQFYEINDIPSPNIFPNQPQIPTVGTNSNFTSNTTIGIQPFDDGNQQWECKGEFYFKEVLPFKTSYPVQHLNDGIDAWTEQYRKGWTFGDNRSNTMKQIVVAIAIAKLMARNSFQLKERSINRDWAYRKLKEIQVGNDTTLIPIIQPEQAGNISFGGSPKIINTF